MGNEFKVMEMNVLFEVQRALAEVILSHSNKWKRRGHMVPSPPTLICQKERERDVSLGTDVLLLVLSYCYCISSTFVHAGHPRSLSLWSSCVIACVHHTQQSRIDRELIFAVQTLLKQSYSGCAALMLFQVNSCPSRGHLQATSGQTHGYLTSSLC